MESGPILWLIILTAGAVALCLGLAYGIMQNRKRTAAEKELTADATRRERERESHDES